MGFPRTVVSLLSSMFVAASLGELEATAHQASPSCTYDSSGSCAAGKSAGYVLLQKEEVLLQKEQRLGAGTVDSYEVEEAQGLFPSTCRSRREKIEYAVHVAHKCGAGLKEAWKCLRTLASPQGFMDCVKVVHTNPVCKEAISRGCGGGNEPKCSRCKTNEPMSNQKHGCLLEIFRGDSSNAACKLLSYSSGRYPRKWFRTGKDNYRFYGNCSEAEDKGGALFTQHVMCPAP